MLFFFNNLLVRFIVFLDPFTGIISLKHWGSEPFDVVVRRHHIARALSNCLVDKVRCFVPFWCCFGLLALLLIAYGLWDRIGKFRAWGEALIDQLTVVTLVPTVEIATDELRGWPSRTDGVVFSTQRSEEHFMKSKIIVFINFRQFVYLHKIKLPPEFNHC